MHGPNDPASIGVHGIYGGAGDDDLKGAFYLSGGGGDDTYRVAQGDTTGLIYSETGGYDQFIFEDIALSDVSTELVDLGWITDRLRISWTNDDGSSQDVDIEQDGAVIEEFHFADGAIRTASELWAL